MKTVVVLGGLGYIGTHLVKMLLDNKYKVKILDCEVFGKKHAKKILRHPNCSYLRGDIRNSLSLARIMKGADCVVHLAGLVGDPACSIDEDDTWLNNTLSSRLIVDVANHYKIKRLIFASSCSVYGASPAGFILNEGSYLNPVSLYAKTKIDSEKIFYENFNGSYTALRLGTVFGYSLRMRFDLVANIFTIRAIKNGSIDVYGGTQYRPFIHCIDAAKAFLSVVMHENTETINREVFNICVENISIRDLGDLVIKIIPDAEINYVDVKEDNRNYKVSSEKARWILDYEPLITLADGIADMKETLTEGFDDWENNYLYYNHRMN